jgi:D-xylose transport system substrate-binding protein
MLIGVRSRVPPSPTTEKEAELRKREIRVGRGARRLLFLLALAVAALAFVAAGCGGDDDEGGGDGGGEAAACDKSVWVLLPDSASSARWETDDRPAFEEALDAAGVDYTIVNAEGDAATQQSQAEQAIADDAGVILMTSLDTGSGGAIIDQAKDAGIPIVEYDRFNTGSSGGDAYVSFDNVKVGATMAEVLEPLIDDLGVDTPRVVMLNGGEEDNNSFLFRDGYAETVEARADAGDWEIVADQFVPAWDNAEALTLMEQILVDADNDVNAVFAANDGLASSTISALEAAGLDPTTIPISGQDATAAGIQNVLLGKQAMSVYKPIYAEAAVASDVALALCGGEDVSTIESDYEFTLIGINSEDGKPTDSPDGDGVVPYFALVPIGVVVDNVSDTVIADGFRTVEELCTGDVAETDWCQENG